MLKKVLAAAFVGVLAGAGLASAHAGHEHKAMGTVAAVDAKHVEVTDKDGKKTSYQLTPETTYKHGTMAAEVSHVAVGQRVVIVYIENERDKTNVAKQVLIGVMDTAPSQPHAHH